MTFREQPCYLHKSKLLLLNFVAWASLKMCQTIICGACWQEQEQAAVNFRECRERSKRHIFSLAHTNGDGPQLQSLCVLKWSLYLRGDERVRDVKRGREWRRMRERDGCIALHCTCFVLVLLSLWQVWTAPYQTLPISGDATQPVSQYKRKLYQPDWESAFFNSLPFFLFSCLFILLFCLLILSCLFVLFVLPSLLF